MTAAINPPLGNMPSIEWLFCDQLAVDEAYQRRTDNDASRRLISRIASNFDWRLFGVLMVSRRPDGSRMVIDGQHRWSGASRRGDIPQVPCCVSTYETAEDEAKMFILANRSRKAMNRLDDFHAALAAGDDEALKIDEMVRRVGLRVARATTQASWAPGEVAFTSTIARIARKYGDEAALGGLEAISEAFPGEVLVHGGSLFAALVEIAGNPPVELDADRLFQALLAFDMKGWGGFVDKVKGGNTRASAMKQALLMAYQDIGSPEKAIERAVAERLMESA